MGTPKIEICKCILTAGEGNNATQSNYYFESSYAVYTGPLATAVGIIGESSNSDNDWSQEPLYSIKELLRTGILKETFVEVEKNGSTREYKLYVSSDIGLEDDDLITAIAGGILWNGEGLSKGGKTTRFVNRRRVVSRS